MKKTKIIATVGPSCDDRDMLAKLFDAGANVIRFNFSHADYANAERIKGLIDGLNAENRTNLSTLLDTKGPEIRT